jgi:hypothetical protein
MPLHIDVSPCKRSLIRSEARGADHAGGYKLIDSTLVIVLHNGDLEIARELASLADALLLRS